MNYFLIFASCSSLLLLPSCEKQKALQAECERVETELNNRSQELSSLDAKYAAIGVPPAALEQQRAVLLQNNTKLEQDLKTLSDTCSACEQTLKDARSKVDAYVAKYSR
ncbi:hypothetical protein [Prosthecobacter sp.]|uniref:hypothetical protein n=1 Tax=Prosthecobacter sp. TaxID=1965333 RepID=UPI001D83FC3B|nr:hypothetical protein [Prosthecobacter sp.]MCB1278375.1 hypothetical protein [Prosthecobacter sp.]